MDKIKHEFSKRIGHGIRHARIKAGLSQERLAEMCNMHRTYIGMVERGERNMTLFKYIKIAYVLNISPSDILNNREHLDTSEGL